VLGPGSLTSLAVLAAVVAGPMAPSGGRDQDLCERFSTGVVVGALGEPALAETSGLAASHAHDGVLWAHNDSGDAPTIYALSSTGDTLGAYDVAGAAAVDWEDMAVGPGPDPTESVIYIGDIGDNAADRPLVTVYRVAEPELMPAGGGGRLALLDTTEVRYPGGPVDVEALVVDPVDGTLLLVTKDLLGASRVLQVSASSLGNPGVVDATEVGGFDVPVDVALGSGLPGTMVTAADVSPDGSVVLVRTYQAVLAFARPLGAPLAEAFTDPPCLAPQQDEAQGEAIAFARDGTSYLTVSEGPEAAVHRFDVTPAPSETTTTTAPPPATTTPVEAPAPGEDDTRTRGWVTVILAITLVGVAAMLLRHRRRPRLVG